MGGLIRQRFSIDETVFESAINQNKENPTQPLVHSKKDLFLFKRKNVDQKEYFNAKSVINLDEEETEEIDM